MPTLREKYQNFKSRFKKTLKNRYSSLKKRFTFSNNRKAELRRTMKHLPNYINAALKGKKFHPTMLPHEEAKLRRGMMERVEWGSYESEKKKLRNIECKRLNDKGSPLTSNEKIYHKEYCLSDENRKVTGRVRINNIQNLNAEILNLPVEDPLANARESLEAAAVLLKQLNDILDDSYKSKFIYEQQLYLKEREETLEKLITDIRDYTESIKKDLEHWDTDDAKMLAATADEMKVATDTIFKEIDDRLDYTIDGARSNIKLAIDELKEDKYKNMTPAVHLMKGQRTPRVQNIALLGNYSEALQAYYRKLRESRVRRASRGGYATRRRRH